MQIVVKCCLNHLRKKYGVLNNNGSAEKKWLVDSTLREHVQSELMEFSKLCFNLVSISDLKDDEFCILSQE